MNWDERTATGREFLIIQNRKNDALNAMGPDYFGDTPERFADYMSENIVYRSEMPPMRLDGPRAVMNFLRRENNLYNGIGHSAEKLTVEGERGETLLLIRERGAIEGALIDLVLDRDGKVAEIFRFSEKKEQYRTGLGGGIFLYPARTETDTEGGERYIDRKEDEILITSIYRAEMELLFELVGDVYNDMEERRYMDMADWVAIVDIWKRINEAADPEPLKEELFRPLTPYFENNRRYHRQMEEMFADVWAGRDDYTRRMQRMLEEYVYTYRDDWNLMSKF
jgi:hypothetical protein